MTPNPSFLFKDGKPKPGVFKIQNVCTETFVDIEVHSRSVCCRPAKDLGEGRGVVRQYPLSLVHVTDDYKWEIKQLGAGYMVQRVSLSISFHTPSGHEQRAI